jgi:hypothetical protein
MGAILLAILFGGVAGYRMVRPSPSAISPVAIPDAPAPSDSTPAASAPVVPTAPVATPPVGAEVPPPPPVAGSAASRRTARRNPTSATPTAKIIIVDPALAVEEPLAPAPELKAVETPKPEKVEPAPVDPPVAKADAPVIPQTQPAVANDGAPKTDAHGNRVGNAFRRLLHIPKKDAQPDTLKQP